ncbi:nucleoside-diphosphate kinase [Terrilactibacillus laevilacticus]|uniref:Nucleoside diphosphate kinase n=1 Tax=Terrilactibacillus laevilacticus TaxID=1380157 RepID=A0ABW5PRY1_9BACI|nr:nucleoside-diphosphate kinase [Terrilactibacillus laevilacticus]
MEKTFLMVKPDGVQRQLIGAIVHRFEEKGFKLVGAKFMQISRSLAEQHYAEHQGKPFFEDLVQFITSGPVFAMVWEGRDVIRLSRKIMGATNPLEAAPGTIRSDYSSFMSRNLIHGSDSLESAEREIHLFFNSSEIIKYEKAVDQWI